MRRHLFAIVFISVPLALALAAAQRASGAGPAAIDRAVDPCTDFYQFACGDWMKNNPIPPDRASWGQLAAVQERNQEKLHAVLEAAASGRDTDTKKIGDYYASCMDEAAIDRKGAAPLEAELNAIAAMRSAADLPPVLAALHEDGVNAFFRFGSSPDYENAASEIAVVRPGGLGLPDRDYYFREDQKSIELRKAYAEHVAKMAQLLVKANWTETSRPASDGHPGDRVGTVLTHPPADADAVMRVETALAKAQLDVVARREPKNVNHKMPLAELQRLMPSFDWSRYLAALHAPSFQTVNVSQPDFMKAFDAAVSTMALADLQAYLRWHAVHAAAFMLSKPFVDEDFRFFGTTLTGAAQLRPRWKRCVEYTDRDLGEALGRRS